MLASYGTGAIMAVPAHDERDFDFATRHGLPIPVVISADGSEPRTPREPYTGDGIMVHSGPYSGLGSAEGRLAVTREMERTGRGRGQVNYRLRDWLISRQRYWGTPIPVVYCPHCGTLPVPEGELPVLLPPDAEFVPTGRSPLTLHAGFLHTRCPNCHGPVTRETDTMDTFFDSSWYQYRYLSPHYAAGPFDPAQARAWLPVDVYTGGVEHATMHLLYTRFFTKAMRDMGLTDQDEPMPRLFNQGVILGENSEKMSKSRGNVVNPDDLTVRYGADAVRVYLMFIGPWEAGGPWNPQGMEGAVRFLQRVWRLVSWAAGTQGGPDPAGTALRRRLHQTVRTVGEDLERFSFNTAIAALMSLVNEASQYRDAGGEDRELWREVASCVTRMLAPLAPHLAEECWELLGGERSVHEAPWPAIDEGLLSEEALTLVVQVDGRVRDRVAVPAGAGPAEQQAAALGSPRVAAALAGATPGRVVVVPGRLVNIVTRR